MVCLVQGICLETQLWNEMQVACKERETVLCINIKILPLPSKVTLLFNFVTKES